MEVSMTLNAHPGGSRRMDAESETLIPIRRGGFFDDGIAHALRAEGFDASEDGTGRGTPLVAFQCQGNNVGEIGTLRKGNGNVTGGVPFIAFSSKDHGADASADVAPTLRAMGHSGSHANAGGQLAVAFDTTQITSKGNYSAPKLGDPCHPLAAGAHPPAIAFNWQGGGDQTTLGYDPDSGITGAIHCGQTPAIVTPWAVRRLIPRECDQLQGFEPDYTLIEYRGKPAADGPRYKALGNSMAVPVIRWILSRIETFERDVRPKIEAAA